MTALQITISGRVQGVGFRYYIFRAAQELRIKGIIKNLPDGKVYIEAEGDPQNIEIFLEKCREGPPWLMLLIFILPNAYRLVITISASLMDIEKLTFPTKVARNEKKNNIFVQNILDISAGCKSR